MNFLRRFVLLLYGLALLALVTVILLFPDAVAGALASLGDISPTVRAVVTAVVDLVILVALFLVVRSPRYANHEGLIVKTPGALADVSIPSARDRILKTVQDVPNVVAADLKLKAPQGKADIDLAVEVAGANINVPNKQKEIDRALRQVTLKQLGLQLATRPRVHIQLVTEEELRARDEASRAATLPPPPPPVPVAETWSPAPPPPETRSVAPAAAAVPMAVPVAVEPPAPIVEEEPLPIEVSPTPVWEAPIVPPDEREAPTADDLVLEPVNDDIAEPDWLASEPGGGILVDEAQSTELDDESLRVPPVGFVIPPASEAEAFPEADIEAGVNESDLDVPPPPPEPEAAPDEPLTVPPLDFLAAPSDEPESDAAVDIDPAILEDIDSDQPDWLTVESSPDADAGLNDDDDDARSRRGPNNTSPPLPELD